MNPMKFQDHIQMRADGIHEWLKAKHPEVFREQRHLDDCPENAYWHYGYTVALRDVLRLLGSPAGERSTLRSK